MKKIWFYCYQCGKYNWVPAIKELLAYYDGVETSYCPTCDDETICEYDIDKKPIRSFITI